MESKRKDMRLKVRKFTVQRIYLQDRKEGLRLRVIVFRHAIDIRIGIDLFLIDLNGFIDHLVSGFVRTRIEVFGEKCLVCACFLIQRIFRVDMIELRRVQPYFVQISRHEFLVTIDRFRGGTVVSLNGLSFRSTREKCLKRVGQISNTTIIATRRKRYRSRRVTRSFSLPLVEQESTQSDKQNSTEKDNHQSQARIIYERTNIPVERRHLALPLTFLSLLDDQCSGFLFDSNL